MFVHTQSVGAHATRSERRDYFLETFVVEIILRPSWDLLSEDLFPELIHTTIGLEDGTNEAEEQTFIVLGRLLVAG